MTPEQLSILQHSLGVDQYGRGNQYRNHFVTDPDCADGIVCEYLVSLGYMDRNDSYGELTGGMSMCRVTDAGKKAMRETSPVLPKKSRGARRYEEWQSADCGIPFGDWLKRKQKVSA